MSAAAAADVNITVISHIETNIRCLIAFVDFIFVTERDIVRVYLYLQFCWFVCL